MPCRPPSWLDLRALTPHRPIYLHSAHTSFGGPKGVGILVERGGPRIDPLIIGGGQERERRSGTHNVAGIVAAATALRSTDSERATEIPRLIQLRDRLVGELVEQLDDVTETIPRAGGEFGVEKVAGSAHVCIGGIESEALLFLLDEADVCVHRRPRRARAVRWRPSHVLAADGRRPRGRPRPRSGSASGHASTEADVDRGDRGDHVRSDETALPIARLARRRRPARER